MGVPKKPVKPGWFHTEGRLGDRSLEQQLMGLDPLFAACQGKTVLDVGCAEGLISIELAKRGALKVHGVEIVSGHLDVARRLAGDLPVTFALRDANTWQPKKRYDIVILLAILHKFWNPTERCQKLVASAREMVVIRLPPKHAPTIMDARSEFKPHHIGKVMDKAGFTLTQSAKNGPLDEWVGYYTRN